MFCLLCQKPKAGVGAYLPNSSIRVCVDCFVKTVGTIPLPSGAAGLVGKFADAKTLASSLKREGAQKAGSIFSDLSKSVAGGRLNGITDGTSNTVAELNEAKEFAQEKLLGSVGSIKTKLHDRAGALEEKLGEHATGLKKKLNSKAGKFLRQVEGLSGRLA